MIDSGSEWNDVYDIPPEHELPELFPCADCGRKFNASSLVKHARVCRSVFKKKEEKEKVTVPRTPRPKRVSLMEFRAADKKWRERYFELMGSREESRKEKRRQRTIEWRRRSRDLKMIRKQLAALHIDSENEGSGAERPKIKEWRLKRDAMVLQIRRDRAQRSKNGRQVPTYVDLKKRKRAHRKEKENQRFIEWRKRRSELRAIIQRVSVLHLDQDGVAKSNPNGPKIKEWRLKRDAMVLQIRRDRTQKSKRRQELTKWKIVLDDILDIFLKKPFENVDMDILYCAMECIEDGSMLDRCRDILRHWNVLESVEAIRRLLIHDCRVKLERSFIDGGKILKGRNWFLKREKNACGEGIDGVSKVSLSPLLLLLAHQCPEGEVLRISQVIKHVRDYINIKRCVWIRVKFN